MPDLLHSLQKHDIGHLRIVAGLWGLELESNETDAAREELAASLLDVELAGEILETLSPIIRAALNALLARDGRIPWAEFTRQFGDIREMGAGRRDRERPHLKPASIAEALFYRGLLARAFFDTASGPQEFAYIPDDLLELVLMSYGETRPEQQRESIKEVSVISSEVLGRPASAGEKGKEVLATDHILDDATTLLAALRMGKAMESDGLPSKFQGQAPGLHKHVLLDLLTAAKLIKKGVPQADVVKKFLEIQRDEALQMLTDAWQASDKFNELRQLPNLICEGEWTNQPQETREFLLNVLDAIPEGKWWSISALLRDIKQKYADFQRPAGDYDSWFIKRASDGQYLRGFAYWDEVDGTLVRYFVTNILHWLGQVDLCFAEDSSIPTSFRVASRIEEKEERGKVSISSSGKITAPRLTPRVVRYQLARFCEWDDDGRVGRGTSDRIAKSPQGETTPDEYRYHVTPHSLNKAKEQGLKVEHLLALLAKQSDAGIPPVFVKALKRWEANGTEARVETQVVLRVSRPEILEEMRRSKAAKYLGEVLGPTTVVIKSGAIQKVMEALTELGLLMEVAPAVVSGGEEIASRRSQ